MFWILVSAAIIAVVYFYLIKPVNYWSRKGVIQKSVAKQWVDLLRFIFQHIAQAELVCEFYNQYPDKRYSGAYQFLTPVLLLRDPDLIKQIAVKDFEHFLDHNQFIPEDMEPLWGKNLIALKGDRWRDMRATLSPSFTSSKMKSMFVLMNDCAKQFSNYYFKHDGETEAIEMKDAFTRYTNDVIASTAFGITCDSLIDRDNEFYLMGKDATNFGGFWKTLKFFVMIASPTLAKIFGITMFSPKVAEFFRRLVRTNIESREKNGVIRYDMIHLLMEAKSGRLKHEDQNGVVDNGFAVIEESSIGKEEKRRKQLLTDDDLTAQALIFFFAGFETVSVAMCFLAYELAVNPDIQETLRKEIDETLENCGGSITYDALLRMKYMDMVVSETLRKWPAATAVDRVCVKPYTIEKIREGEQPVHIEKGELVWLPIFGIHRCGDFYPQPEKFDPERFSDENKGKINPYAYIPFGAGPRSCIGNRFALLEIKTVAFHILSNFEIIVTEKTTIPFKIAKNTFNLAAENGFWFGLKRRNVT